jgi:hypothetical protein
MHWNKNIYSLNLEQAIAMSKFEFKNGSVQKKLNDIDAKLKIKT